jgi:hypothetical protein
MDNFKYEDGALNFIKYFMIFGWSISFLAFIVFLSEFFSSSYESEPFWYFLFFLAWSIYMWSLKFIFQIFFYLKGIYEELRAANPSNIEMRNKRNF